MIPGTAPGMTPGATRGVNPETTRGVIPRVTGGGSGRFWPIFLRMRGLGLFFGLTERSHSCILESPVELGILARETSRGTPDARRRRQDAGWLRTRAAGAGFGLGHNPDSRASSGHEPNCPTIRSCPSESGYVPRRADFGHVPREAQRPAEAGRWFVSTRSRRGSRRAGCSGCEGTCG
jgi:hypothetical protein